MILSSNRIFSSIFFFFAVFVFLSLIVSQISQNFNQLFLIFSYPHRAFDFISNILLFLWVLMCIAFCIYLYKKHQHKSLESLLSVVIAVFVSIVLVLRLIKSQLESQTDSINYAVNDTISGFILWKFFDICVYCISYGFFVLLPLALLASKLRLNPFSKWGKLLEKYKPSICVVLFALFALALQPYYAKKNIFLYIDVGLFYIGILLLIISLWRNRELFSFYEYANILWLIVGIFFFSASSKIIAQADYHTVRILFLIIAFMGWCGDFMGGIVNGKYSTSSVREILPNKILSKKAKNKKSNKPTTLTTKSATL